MASDLDLSCASDVEKYLDSTPFASTEVISLSGGSANYVFRLRLKTPYNGRPTAVLKHSKPYSKSDHGVGLDPRRQIYEVGVMRRVGEWLPADSVVRTPEVYHFDKQAYAIIMEDAGEGFLSLKEFMQVSIEDGGPTVEMAKQIGTALGKFLGELHVWGRTDDQLMKLAKEQEAMKKVMAWFYYDRLVEALHTQPKLLDPPIDVAKDEWEKVGELSRAASELVQRTSDAFIMGDFWPGNMRVVLKDGHLSHILLHDWEAVRTGQPGLELGQVCAEIHLLGSPTNLFLPDTFPFPIKIISLDTSQGATIERGTRLLSYSFVYLPPQPDAQPETRFGTWDSAIEGTLDAWRVSVGDVISSKKARDRPVVAVLEPCKHGTQLRGLCVLCGKDMTNVDYTGYSDASRASIQMTHSANGPTVSLEEAQRIERETAEHLLKSRKLSLIVDLDQTIVHATVDPTVGEWIAEGEAWESRQAAKAAKVANKPKSTTPVDSDDSDDSDSDTADEDCNPNWEALKDVKKFRLGPESFMPPSSQGGWKGKGKSKHVESDGCMYYIKPRPGWKEFLDEVATKYELHVYTMGTRAYAEEVCAAIDPDRKIFGGRILSRDESGSLTQKSLQRLFPCDTSMVVIIDDRADVWEWSPNLVKVIPYDFFVGIGDINSSFLPKIEPLTPSKPSTSAKAAVNGAPANPPSPEEADRAEREKQAIQSQNNAALDAQLEQRPLAKKQEELQEHEKQEHDKEKKEPTPSPTPNDSKEPTPTPKSDKLPKTALLKNDDCELVRIGKILGTVHSRFFDAYDSRHSARSENTQNPRRKHGSSSRAYDVTRIIPRLRSDVLEGVHILFSSVIPLDTRPESTEVWRMAHMFGARVSTDLGADVTHVVAAKRGTVKVDMARKRGGIKIVWLAWFLDSVALWQRQDEKPYLLDDPPSTLMPGAQHKASSSPPGGGGAGDGSGGSGSADDDAVGSLSFTSDLELDSDEWDQEMLGETKDPSVLELGELNWADINKEVEDELAELEAESDEDDEDDMRSVRSEDMSDAVSLSGSVNNTPTLKRKRLRSVTPSDGGYGSSGGGPKENDLLRSPLSKRKKLAADRTGYSRLKEGISATELVEGQSGDLTPASSPKVAMQEEMDEEEYEDDDEDEEIDEEDDFLLQAMQDEG